MNVNLKKISSQPKRLQATRKKHYPPNMSVKNCDQLDSYRDKRNGLTGLSDEEFAKAISMNTISLS